MTKARDGNGPASQREGPPSNKKPDVGNLLKSAYDETVREAIPPEFLDLLGKLD